MADRKRRARGYIEERPDRTTGGFRAVVYAGVDPLTRKPRYLRKTASTYREAKVELTKLLSQVDEGRHPRTDVTVGQVLDMWLEVAELEPTTRERYDGLIRRYLRPTFGSLRAAKLDAETLERYYVRLRRCSRMCARPSRDHACRPLSPSTVRQVHFILRAALERSVRWRYLSVNPAELAEPPAFERPEPDPPSATEVAAVLNETQQDPVWGTFLWLTMVTGCRRGEMCALRWTDLDVERAILTVERSYAQTSTARWEQHTKTRQKRRVALDQHTVDLLKAHRERCESDCHLLGFALPTDAFIFTARPDGSTPLLPDTVSQKYRRLARRAGLRSTRLHSLRH